MNSSTDNIPFAKPAMGREEEDAVLAVMRSGWLTTGKVTLAFEKEFAAYTGASCALAVASGTAGLHLALESCGIQPDTYVLTTPYTFAATAEIIRYVGAHPIFADIDECSFNLSPVQAEKVLIKYNGKISAAIPVHMAGRIADMDALSQIFDSKNIPVIEDCAHAFPVAINNRFAGRFGKLGVFSFYANKTITTGEGGMVITDDVDAAGRMRVMRTHGIDREAWDRYTSAKNSWYYEIVEPGFKYNLTDLASAIGRVQLKRAADFLERRRAIAEMYAKGFSGLDFLIRPEPCSSHAWHLYIIRIVPDKLTITRNEFIEKLNEAGIGTSVHYTPLHVMPY
ncbi:MAG: DegT/DnrJ/EryC1/StrS family aminotransferase, partial [Spirochaetaceae bacterium]